MADKPDNTFHDLADVTQDLIASLSARELDIARLYAEGKSSKEVAEMLFIAPTTVRNHVAAIYRKLKIRNKTELVNLFSTSEMKRVITQPESEREQVLELPDNPRLLYFLLPI